jgi:adenosylmethionine-8-amino-7-oxononanoate aminotransferase
VLWIDDEVMAGFGRTGKKMAIEHYGDVVPDIMCCAKGMSCGYTPIGATVANDKVFNAIMIGGSGSFHHGHTYAGNPLSAGIAAKVIEIIERENYVKNAEIVGDYLLDKLESLKKYPIVGDVRGKGLMMGMEFVKNQTSKEPFDPAEKINGKITGYCMDAGIVPYPGGGSADGVRGDHVQITPPINITHEQADEIVDALEYAIKKTCEELL